MRIKLNQTIKGYDNKELLDQDNKPSVLRDVFAIAINSQTRDEILTAEQKAKIYQLSVKLYSDNEVELTLDDRAFIKERAGKIWTPLIYGRICEILEDSEVEVEEKPLDKNN